MPSDISADVAYIGGVWCEGVLYGNVLLFSLTWLFVLMTKTAGVHLVLFVLVCCIVLNKSYNGKREITSCIILLFSTSMFILSTVHVTLALHQLLQGFVYHTPEGSPRAFFRNNIFPQRKAIYIVNTLLGDSFLIWRVSVIWRAKRAVCIIPSVLLLGTSICGIKTIVANSKSVGHSVFTSNIIPWVTSTFVLNMATQITSTALLAGRIYWVSHLPGPSSKKKSFYVSLVWLIVESGAIYTLAVLIQLITYMAKMNAGVILEFMAAQLSGIAPALIVVRVGLQPSYEEHKGNQEDVILTTLHDTIPTSTSSRTGKRLNLDILHDQSLSVQPSTSGHMPLTVLDENKTTRTVLS